MPWTEILQELFEVSELPPITGLVHLGGVIGLSINTADFLEDIFVNQNKYHTKSEPGRAQFSIMTQSLNFQKTEDPEYAQKRKAISTALFKQKLLAMAPTMKRVTLNEVKRWQDEGLKEIDLVKTTMELYGRIIMTICIGAELAETKVPIECEDGNLKNLSLASAIDVLFQFSLSRGRFVINQLFPKLKYYTIMPSDRRHGRNVERVKTALQKILDIRRAKKDDSDNDKSDLMSILMSLEFY